MSKTLLSKPDRMEALSRVWVQALAANVGYTVSKQDFDRDGVDMTVHAGDDGFPQLDLQLKATTNKIRETNGTLSFDLKRSNYEKLIVASMVPRLLIVYFMKSDDSQWLTRTEAGLRLSGCAYWFDLSDMKPTTNVSSVRISIPESNVFDETALQQLMQRFRGSSSK